MSTAQSNKRLELAAPQVEEELRLFARDQHLRLRHCAPGRVGRRSSSAIR